MDKSPSSSLASSSSKGEKDWVFLKEGTNDNFDNIVSMKIPYNTIRTSHKQTNCKLNNNINKHKYKIERRECKGHNEDIGGEQVRVKCPVEYKVEFCEECNNFRIHQDNEHVIQCAYAFIILEIIETLRLNHRDIDSMHKTLTI